MEKLTLNHMENSFVSVESPSSNYSKFAYLKIGSGDCERGITKALIKGDISKLPKIENLQKVELELYVKNISSYSGCITIGVYKNIENFYEDTVNWNNAFNVGEEIASFNVSIDNYNSYISIDLTQLCLSWINGEEINNGITLIAKDSIGEVTFVSSRGYNSPKINFYYLG